MNRFLPEREGINPHWFSQWGEKFGASELASIMSANDRVYLRVRDRMVTSLGIDPNCELDGDDVVVANAYAFDRERLSRICGMVMHGELLRNCIGKAEFEFIAKLFTLEDLKIAVSLRHHHPEDIAFNADMSKLSSLIERSGKACLAGWKAGLDEQMALRIKLIENDEQDEEQTRQSVEVGLAWSVTVAVSHSLANENASLAA